jgi:hypothetical protein
MADSFLFPIGLLYPNRLFISERRSERHWVGGRAMLLGDFLHDTSLNCGTIRLPILIFL